MRFPAPDPDLAARLIRNRGDVAALFAEARRLRDEGRGKTVTYSRKVFIPLTTLCRDRCSYCTFAKPPGGGGEFLEPADVLAIAEAGAAHRCTEATGPRIAGSRRLSSSPVMAANRPSNTWPG